MQRFTRLVIRFYLEHLKYDYKFANDLQTL